MRLGWLGRLGWLWGASGLRVTGSWGARGARMARVARVAREARVAFGRFRAKGHWKLRG